MNYNANRVGSVATTYTLHKRTHDDAHMTTLQFFLTNSGDVLRRVYVQQDDPFVEKASVLVSLQCGPVALVHKLPWLLWARIPGTAADQHAVANELLLLGRDQRRLRLPMACVTQDCMQLSLTMPRDMAHTGWRVVCVWDFMSREWRSDAAASVHVYAMEFPVARTFSIARGQLRSMGTPPVPPERRHSNPLA